MITRRRVVVALGAGALAPLASFAQQPAKIARIGILSSESASDALPQSRVQTLRDGLRSLGYNEGNNVVIENRWAEGKYERLPDLAVELVHLKVDVIVTMGIKAAVATKRATTTIPIVLPSTSSDVVAMGLASSLRHPGGNFTGSAIFGPEIIAKRLELLKDALPRITRIAVLTNPANPSFGAIFDAMKVAAKSLKLALQVFEMRAMSQLNDVIKAMVKGRVDAVVVHEDTMFSVNAKLIAGTLANKRLPSAGNTEFGEAGGLIGYGVNGREMYLGAAVLVDKILKGAKPGDLPIEQATRFDLVVNKKTAKALGVKIPNSILVRATKVIE